MKTFPAEVANSIIRTAGACLSGAMRSSADLALQDARALYERGERYDYAAGRALASIAYSVGICSAQYRHAAVLFEDARS